MTTIQYLPALPEVIELDMEGLYLVMQEFEPINNLEELQLRAETALVKEMQRNKQQRHRIENWF